MYIFIHEVGISVRFYWSHIYWVHFNNFIECVLKTTLISYDDIIGQISWLINSNARMIAYEDNVRAYCCKVNLMCVANVELKTHRL